MRAIEVSHLRKSYGALEAVAGVDLSIEAGEVFCFLGPNGAGKTTTVEILEGYRKRTAGYVSVLGFDPEHGGRGFRDRIGIMLQESGLQPELSVIEALSVYRMYYSRPKPARELLELVELEGASTQKVESLSGGQRRRLDLALALIGDPDLVFLDEPTTGFDPAARRGAWRTIENLCHMGKTIFLTTHYMEEAQALADRVAVIAKGRIVAEGSPDRIGGRDTTMSEVRFLLPGGVAASDLPRMHRVIVRGERPAPDDGSRGGAGGRLDASVEVAGESVVVKTERPDLAVYVLVRWALRRDIALDGLTVSRPSLEEVYLALTGGAESPAGAPGDRPAL